MLRLLIAGILTSSLLMSAWAGKPPEAPSRWLLRFKPEISRAQAPELLRAAGLEVGEHLPEIDLWVTQVAEPEQAQRAVATLGREGQLLHAEPDAMIFHADATPNDPLFARQTELERIRIRRAWDTSTGSPSVLVAISDSGAQLDHPDLSGQLWKNPGEVPGNGVDDDHNGYVDDVTGWDFVAGDNAPGDENGHGTHVAGTIGAEANNAEGVAGVSWRISLLPLRFLDAEGNGSTLNGVKSILYAAKAGARVVNCSWGGGGFSSSLRDAINYAYGRGTLVIAAAGNESKDADAKSHYPSSYDVPGVLAVAATQSGSSLASFSNYGLHSVDLAAPGVSVLSTYPEGRYKRLSGTSMATPIISGVAALVLAREPGLSAHALRNALLNAAAPREPLAGRVATGGEIDAAAAVEKLTNDLRIWPGRLTLKVGAKVLFTARSAVGAPHWSVSDAAVASVSTQGELTALKTGSVDLTLSDATGAAAPPARIDVLEGTVPPPPGGCSRSSSPKTPADLAGATLSFGLPFAMAGLTRIRRRGSRLRGRFRAVPGFSIFSGKCAPAGAEPE